MLVRKDYTKDGIVFRVYLKHRLLSFPLEGLKKDLVRDADWPALNVLEELWYQGLLRQEGDGWLLPSEGFFQLDEESIELLQLPPYEAEIGIREQGNIGAANYGISWYVLVHGRDAGRKQHLGVIVSAGGFEFRLSEAGWKLVQAIESFVDDGQPENRAGYQAKVKYLANQAGAKIDAFTDSRDFLFAEDVNLGLTSEDDHHLTLIPELGGIPEELQRELPNEWNRTPIISKGGKNHYVFIGDKAKRTFESVKRLPELTGAQVPAFIDNPLTFIPEDIEFDPDLFSKRVKGLKVRTAKVVPYVKIEQDPNDPGWFNVDTGFHINEGGETSEKPEADTESENDAELQKLIRQARESGEDYIYHKGRWLNVKNQAIDELPEQLDKLNLKPGKHRIKAVEVQKILDIFENIDGIEYNEGFFTFAKQPLLLETVAKCFHGTLYPHQQEGYAFLKSHYQAHTGVLLADDMGLGKTAQVIALFAYLLSKELLAPALIVMPSALIGNWQEELSRFTPDIRRIVVHQGSGRVRNSAALEEAELVLTTYETLARDQAMMGKIKWSCVICDEVQKIKNFRTYAASAVKGMNTSCRIAMTGTPVENRLSELWSIADFAQPGLLGSFQEFHRNFEKPIQSGTGDRQLLTEQLVNRLSPIFIRRTKEEVLASRLPEKYENHVYLPLNNEQLALYRSVIQEMQNGEKGMALAAIQKLIALSSHPRLVSKKGFESAKAKELMMESPKLRWMVDKLEEIRKKKEKVIIFARYKQMQAIIRQVVFEEFKVDARILNGEVTENRQSIIKEFSAVPGFNVMILSPRAAGVGLNITAANHVIHYMREWNPAIENQATDRAYRIGQERNVSVYYPVMEAPNFKSAEKKLDELLTAKRALMSQVIIPTNLEITKEDFDDILLATGS